MERESMEVDVVIVGGGPAGLAAACRLGQLAQSKNEALSIVVVEKGSEIGAHILSGAVMDPKAMNELFPDWQALGAPLDCPVTDDEVYFLPNAQSQHGFPHFLIPPASHNAGNYVVSLANVCRWLGEQAEGLGIDIFPGFAATEVLFDDAGAVAGIATGDMGIDANGQKKSSYAPGMELRAKYTLFTEGCRGHLGKQLIEKFKLTEQTGTQHYGIGIKELWDIDPELSQPG